jgi:hypothetical protein
MFLISQGYMWRKTTRKMMDAWERRWFVLDDTKLYFLSDGDEGHRINVRLQELIWLIAQ